MTPDTKLNWNLIHGLASGTHAPLPMITGMVGTLRITVDGIMFDSGDFVGPDDLHTSEYLEGKLNGERDLKEEVAAGHDIPGLLRSKTSISFNLGSQLDAGFDYYHYHQKVLAEIMLKRDPSTLATQIQLRTGTGLRLRRVTTIGGGNQ